MTPRQRVVLVLCFFPFLLFSQDQYRLGKAPFFATFNARKLALALTKDLPNDSLKALSIYTWTVNHINYDARRFAKGKPSFMRPKKILFHRKAYCIGYSILIDSLCEYAGLKAETVIGYDYDPWYEARDTFFVNDHAWNVIMVDGQWELVDATWASGMLVPKRQRLMHFLNFVFHIGFRQKYKFVRKRNDFYYNTPPAEFIYTHLPGTPAWQLLPCSVPIDSFQRSPTAVMHFLRDSTGACRIMGNDSVGKILAEPENRHQLEMGKQAAFYNPQNRLNISYGYMIYADDLFRQGEDERQEPSFRVLLYDSAAHQYDSAARYFAKTYSDYKAQEHFFLDRNERMRQELRVANKSLYQKHLLLVKSISAEHAKSRSFLHVIFHEQKAMKQKARKLGRQRLKTKRPTTSSADDLVRIRQLQARIDSNNRQIALEQDSLGLYGFNRFAADFPYYDSVQSIRFDVLERLLRDEFHGFILRRFYEQNNYDTLMIRLRDTVLVRERRLDSLGLGIPTVKQLPASIANRQYAETIRRMQQLELQNMKLCKKLARLEETSFSEDSAFAAAQAHFSGWTDSLERQNRFLADALSGYGWDVFRLKWLHRIAALEYRWEMHAEDARFKITNRFFRGHFGGYAISMKRNAHFAKKSRALCRRKAKKLEHELKKAEKEAEKNEKGK